MRVLESIEDAAGDRCVDILALDTGYGYSECRRDPEDPHGWRRVSGITDGFPSERAARNAAQANIGWLE